MKAIWQAGLSVPDDVAIVGAGDVAHGDLLRVPLTTVSWSKNLLGRRAAELLLEQIGNQNGNRRARSVGPFRRVVIPPRLVIRKSCGGAP
jgi:LacI family transcriptional regulator